MTTWPELDLVNIMTTTHEEEDNSNDSNKPQKSDDSGRKRKAAEERSDDETEERALRRKRNREAAKKCREKKVQETESLRQKNEELEREKCCLVKQRDELMKRCSDLEEALRHHKEQGCIILDSSPPYTDLSDILDPSTPPSPSFAGSPTPSSSPCPSPALSPGPVPLANSTLQTYKALSAPIKQTFGSATTTLGGQDNAVPHQTAGSRVNNSCVTSTETTEMRARLTTTPLTSQQTTLSVQESPAQQYLLRVRGEDGRPKNLQLSREDYIKVMERLAAQKTSSVNQHRHQSGFSTAVDACSPQPHQVFSTSQIPKQEIQPEVVSCAGQPVNFQAKASAQNCNQSDMFSFDNDFMSFMDMLDGKSHDYLLVNPNDVLMKNEPMDVESDKKTFQHFEDDSVATVAIQHKVADIKYASDNDAQVFAGQLDGAGLNALSNPGVDHLDGLHLVLTANKLRKEDCLSNDQMHSIIITDTKRAQAQEISTKCCHVSGELDRTLTEKETVAQPMMPAQTGQTVLYTTSTADSVSKPAKTRQGVPVLFHKDEPHVLMKPFMNFSSDRDLVEVSEYEPSFQESLSAMKTVKLRPKATQLINSAPSSRKLVDGTPQGVIPQEVATLVWSPLDGLTIKCAAGDSLGLLRDSQTVNPSETAGFQRAPLGMLPTSQNNSVYDKGLQLAVQQQQAWQMPMTPVPLYSNPRATQSSSVKGKDSVQVEEPLLSSLISESTRSVMEYLEKNSIEVLESV